MILMSKYKDGSYLFNSIEYPVKDYRIDAPLELAKRMVLTGGYSPVYKQQSLDNKCKRILMIRGSGLGDIMFCYPLRKYILEKYPGIKIDFMTSGEYEGLVKFDPTINELLNINDLNKTNYDWAMNLNNIEFHGCFTNYHKIDLFAHLSGVGEFVEDKKLFYKITNEELDWAREYLKDEHVISIVLRTTCESKHMSLERLAGVLQHLGKKFSFVLFDKSREYGGRLSNMLDGAKVYNCCGKYNVRQCAAIMKVCDRVFTPDTGFLHLATSLGCKIVAYFGSIGHKLVITPGNVNVVHSDIGCYPCNMFGCPAGHNKCTKYDQKALASKILKVFN